MVDKDVWKAFFVQQKYKSQLLLLYKRNINHNYFYYLLLFFINRYALTVMIQKSWEFVGIQF